MSWDTHGNIKTLMGLELRRMLFNTLILAASLVLLVSVLLATVQSADAYLWNLRQYDEIKAPREHSPTINLSVIAIARPLPLHIIARGTGDIMERPVAAMRQLEAAFNIKFNVGQERRQKELIYSLVDSVDLLFVVRLLLPILAMLLSYNFICGERQQRTLTQILSNPVMRRTILTAKLLAGAVTLLMIVTIAGLVVLVTLWLMSIQLPNADLWRLGVIIVAVYFYALFFLILGAFVSTLVRGTEISILICLALWCLFVLVSPGAAASLAEALSPVPPAHQIYAQKLSIERNMRGGDAMEGTKESMREINTRVLERIGSVDTDFFNAVGRQQSIARSIGLLSPALCFDHIVTTFASGSIEEEHELLRQMRAYFRRVAQFDDVEQDLFARTTPDDLPEFEYIPIPAGTLISSTILQWGALLLFAIILLLLSYLQFNRYDVRSD